MINDMLKKNLNNKKKNISSHKTKTQISFIMPAYNTERYISDSIKELLKEQKIRWELIIIDDFSSDKTFKIAKSFANKDSRIKVFKNLKKGKVAATNYGFDLSCGKIIKCIDSDDVLSSEYFKYYDQLKNYSAHCHNAFITDCNLNYVTKYSVNPLMMKRNYSYVASKLLTFPKWAWSFDRMLAKEIFPIPKNLTFEDVWINLIIKKFSKNIYHINKPIYMYRQHGNQTFGGILNYNEEIVIFRAKRILKLLNILKHKPKIMNGLKKNIFKSVEIFFQIMSQRQLTYLNIFSAKLNLFDKLKIILIKKTPGITKYAMYLKWKLDEIFKN
jgi:glycosyltransferase involved in cell wall biosynthesis